MPFLDFLWHGKSDQVVMIAHGRTLALNLERYARPKMHFLENIVPHQKSLGWYQSILRATAHFHIALLEVNDPAHEDSVMSKNLCSLVHLMRSISVQLDIKVLTFFWGGLSDGHKYSSLQVRATSSSEDTSGSIETEELLADLKQKWDSIENKAAVFIYGGGAILALWLSSTLIRAINTVPLLPKIMELVGIGYSGWFVYQYLLFKSSRKKLAEDIEDLKKQIAGTD